VVGWVFFRAEDFRSATDILLGMIGFNGISAPGGLLENIETPGRFELEALVLIGALLVWTMPNTRQIVERLETVFSSSGLPLFYRRAVPAIAGLLLALALLQMHTVSEFLYFRF